MGLRLLLYWFTMVLLLMAAILSTLMATGVLSHPAHQLSGTLDIQQRNTYAALDSQMDALTAQSMAMSGAVAGKVTARCRRPCDGRKKPRSFAGNFGVLFITFRSSGDRSAPCPAGEGFRRR